MSTYQPTYQHTYRVTGMTCGHCVTAVQEELDAIAEVTHVTVDLASGRVTVDSGRELTRAEVAAAVAEAGYELGA